MQGDFSRFTFDPTKRYTSVLKQQGRVDLDADWNEQMAIQAHLDRTQVVDLIGAENGVPTSKNDPDQPDQAYKDSFKISVTPNDSNGKNDLAIAPGHFYVNGTLCELDAAPVDFKLATSHSNRVKVNTLIVDGRKFEQDQWVKISDNQPLLQINAKIDTQTLELPLSGQVDQPGSLRRITTYKTQPDYPNPEYKDDKDNIANGLYLAYLDVHQFHVTTAEDPSLREVALNVPDTTTRTKTVWQLKLISLNRKFIEENVSVEDKRRNLLERINHLSFEGLKQKFDTFLNEKISLDQQQEARKNFDVLLQTVLDSTPNSPPWRQEFKNILDTATASEQNKLKESFQALLEVVAKEETNRQAIQKPFDQLLEKVKLTPEEEKTVKLSFQNLLEKILPTDVKKAELTQSFAGLLGKATSAQATRKELQDLLKDLIAKFVLTQAEKGELQKSFNALIAKVPSESVGEVDTWKIQFNELLRKVESLSQPITELQESFAAFLDQTIAAEQVLREVESYEKDETTTADLSKPDWRTLVKDAWGEFLQKNKNRKPYMNACAKLCSSGGATIAGEGYRGNDNRLYRVEIHHSGMVGDKPSGGKSNQKATFKWSRDNGSIVGIIDNNKDVDFQRGSITIRKSAQDAWASSKPEQWLEFLNAERELKGLPGQLARLKRVSGNKIEFDTSSLVGDAIPHPTKVRRWDYMTQEASIPTLSEAWYEIADGIKVTFDKDSEYKTGDYWLIPARVVTRDIQWPDNQAEELNQRQSLPQPAHGIYHDYCLLAGVKVENGKFLPLPDEADFRLIFPALAYAFDKRGDVIQGDLGVGIASNEKPIARLHARANTFLNGTGRISQINGTTVTGILSGSDATNFTQELHPGDLIKIDQDIRVIADVTSRNSLTVDQELPPLTTSQTFQYQQPILQLENDQAEAKFTVLANGLTGVGTTVPQTEFEVKGKLKTTDLDVTGRFAAETFQGATFAVTKNPTSSSPVTYGLIRASTNENPKRVEFEAAQANVFAFTNDSKVGIGTLDPKNQLDIKGAGAIGQGFAGVQTAPRNGLLVEGPVAIGISAPDAQAKLHVHGGAARISTDNGGNNNHVQINLINADKQCNFETNCSQYHFNQAITIDPDNLEAKTNNDVLIALNILDRFKDNSHSNVKHYGLVAEESIIKAKSFEGDGSNLSGVVKTTGNNEWDAKLTAKKDTFLATNSDAVVGIGTTNVGSKLSLNGNATIGRIYAEPNAQKAPKNGLLVEGHMGIGNFTLPLNAKLEIQGASTDNTQAALSVTDSERKSLLWVRNDGNVGIGIDDFGNIQEKLQINGSVKATTVKCDKLIVGKAQFPTIPSTDLKLYVNGDLAVEQGLHVKEIAAQTIRVNNQDVNVLKVNDITAGVFKQVSSKVLKEAVSDLSSREATEALKVLNPVKFIYVEDVAKHLNAGFIAEDTPELLTSSDKQSVKIVDIVAILTKAVKDQQMISEELSEVVRHQRSELEALREELRELEARNLASPQPIASFNPSNTSLDEQVISRSPRTSRRPSGSLLRKLKRFIRHLFFGS